jgi:Domain of unknown function (DUF4376)
MTETFAPIMIDGRNWFWQVTDHANQIYSSARNIYVAESDADYTAWKGKGNVVAPVPSEAELWPVLRHYAPAAQFPDWLFNGVTFVQPAFNNLTAAQVKAYAADVRWKKETGGIVFRTNPYDSNREAQTQIASAAAAARINPAFTANWKLSNGTFLVLNATAMNDLYNALQTFVQKCFTTEQQTISNASITTTTQVDAAFGFSNVYT